MGDNIVTVRERAEQALAESLDKNASELRCSNCFSLLKSCAGSLGATLVFPCQKCAEKAAAEKVKSGKVFRWLKEGEDVICPGDLQAYNGSIVPAAEDIREVYNSADHWPTFRQVDISDIRKSIMTDIAALIITGMQF